MQVRKRGTRGYETIQFDKITDRLRVLCKGLEVDPVKIAMATIGNIHDKISTADLDVISAEIADSLIMEHPHYSTLAARITVSNLYKETPHSFSECAAVLAANGRINKTHAAFIALHADALNNMIDNECDALFDYNALNALFGQYLIHINVPDTDSSGNQLYTIGTQQLSISSNDVQCEGDLRFITKPNSEYRQYVTPQTRRQIFDRPQYLYMRVAIDIGSQQPEPLATIARYYEYLSQQYYIHATPTLYNACGPMRQLNSCFLAGSEDSIEGILENLRDVSILSKWAGGIGVHMHSIRSKGQIVAGTGGPSSGLVPQLKGYNDGACCWNQGGRRPGSWAIYLELWHGDILDFLQLKLNQGDEKNRCPDLFYAVWVCDLFVHRLQADKPWSLFSENTAPGLSSVYDGMEVCSRCNFCENPEYNKYFPATSATCPNHAWERVNAFTQLYEKYEKLGRAVDVISPRAVMNRITQMQRESGTPYVCFKDHGNRMSNQSNIGTIKSSNLCAEIFQVSAPDSIACCTLASINLPRFVRDGAIDHEKLYEVARAANRALDICIDQNDYPIDKCRKNAEANRPVALGIQGLADVFMKLRIPFLSDTAAKIDIEIAETIYCASLDQSIDSAAKYGVYPRYSGSPLSRGKLHLDLWLENQARITTTVGDLPMRKNITEGLISGRYDLDDLRRRVALGVRNSLTTGHMPTVSTAVLLSNVEAFEPINSNAFTRNGTVGKRTVINTKMVLHLIELGIWSPDLKSQIIANKGNLTGIAGIPAAIQEIYMTVREMQQSKLMFRAARRSAFIDQSSSLNIYPSKNTDEVLERAFIVGWQLGLKTGSYYIRTSAGSQPLKNMATTHNAAPQETTNDVCQIGCGPCSG